MALGRPTNLALVRPFGECDNSLSARASLRRHDRGGEVGLQSDGKADPAIATGVVKTVGIAVQSGGDGDAIIVVYGPVECMTGATTSAG